MDALKCHFYSNGNTLGNKEYRYQLYVYVSTKKCITRFSEMNAIVIYSPQHNSNTSDRQVFFSERQSQ